jgi:hypothetical protein
MDLPLLVGGLFAAVGAATSIVGARTWTRTREFLRGARTVPGVVVGLVEHQEGGEDWFFPRVRFTTSEGAEITFESGMGASGPTPRVGEAVAVRYRPEQPLRAEIESFLALWGTTVVLAGLGATFLLVGCAVLAGLIPG